MINMLSMLALPVLMAGPTHPTLTSEPVDSSAMTVVVVQNNRHVPVTVYEQDDFGDVKLAVVAPLASMTVGLDHYVLEPSTVQFFIQPKGQLEEATGLLDINPGDHVGVVVPSRSSSRRRDEMSLLR